MGTFYPKVALAQPLVINGHVDEADPIVRRGPFEIRPAALRRHLFDGYVFVRAGDVIDSFAFSANDIRGVKSIIEGLQLFARRLKFQLKLVTSHVEALDLLQGGLLERSERRQDGRRSSRLGRGDLGQDGANV